jgi:hypothetical protein
MNITEEEEIDLVDAKNALNKINKQLAEFNKKQKLWTGFLNTKKRPWILPIKNSLELLKN